MTFDVSDRFVIDVGCVFARTLAKLSWGVKRSPEASPYVSATVSERRPPTSSPECAIYPQRTRTKQIDFASCIPPTIKIEAGAGEKRAKA